MDRVYLMPTVGSGSSSQDPRKPKYADLIDAVSGARWDMVDYGREPVMLVKATAIDASTHATIAADAEVSALPLDLTQQIGANLGLVQTALEDRNIPGSNLVPASWTYRQLVRGVIIVFQFTQRLDGQGVRLFTGGVTVGSQWSTVPTATQTALQDMAASFGFGLTVTGTTTVRQILRQLYDQWPVTFLVFGGEQW